jgi:H+/Cl- antiporter ClcA
MNTKADFAPARRLRRMCLLAVAIGAISAGLAWLLLKLINLFTNLFFYLRLSVLPADPSKEVLGNWIVVVPVIGGLVIGAMAYWGSERIRGHGIPEALEAILFGRSQMDPKVAVLKPVSSAISIGSGGPFGAEGPIIMTGGAVGSLIAQLFNLTSAERKTLLVAGAAGGMSATFGTPIAAALLAVELLLFEWKPRSLIPVALSSAAAAALRPLLLGSGPLFQVPPHPPLGLVGLGVACVAGILAGGMAWLLTAAVYGWEDVFHKVPFHWAWWPAIGGLIVGIGGLIEPRAMGVGYDVIGEMLSGKAVLWGVIALVAVKAMIWSGALGSGTSGGVLAPLLMMGSALGVAEAHIMPAGDPLIWPLVSMAAVMAGVMRSPFTAIMFAFELTHDANALLPLLVASTLAYLVSVLILKRSILTEKVARRGYHIFREYSVDPLERVFVDEVMTRDVQTQPGSMTVAQFMEYYLHTQQKFRGYPVIDDGGKYLGMLRVSELIENAEASLTNNVWKLSELVARDAEPLCHPNELCRNVAARMVREGVERLAVIDEETDKLAGIVTRSDLLKPAAHYYEQEELRERVKWWGGKKPAG